MLKPGHYNGRRPRANVSMVGLYSLSKRCESSDGQAQVKLDVLFLAPLLHSWALR